MSGTEWTAPGQGSTVEEVAARFGTWCTAVTRQHNNPRRKERTNLRLTSSPITEEDWARLESEEFKVGE